MQYVYNHVHQPWCYDRLPAIGEAEKYRDSLRRKDMELKDSERYASVLSADVEKVRICPFIYSSTSLTAYAVASTV